MSSRYRLLKRGLIAATLIGFGCALSGCNEARSSTASAPAAQAQPLNVPVGGIFPNGQAEPPPDPAAKQYEGNAQAINEGSRLFDWYNCSGCHFHGAGGIGPAFNDHDWIYGGRLDQIYASIYQGRPNGMPMWGNLIPSSAIWEIAAYVKSLETNAAKVPIPTKPVAGAPGPDTLETNPSDNASPASPASQ